MTEDSFVRALRDVETRRPPSDIVARLVATRKAKRSPLRWAVPAAASGAVVWGVLAMVMIHPAVSYADVVRKLQEQTQYTITNTRIINEGKDRVQFRSYRDGRRWRYGDTVGLEDRTVQVAHRSGGKDEVLIDAPLVPPQEEFQPERRLWQDANPQVERGVMWNGRRVDVFREGGLSKVGENQLPTNEMIVDPATKLPVQLTEVREGVADIWDFDFTAPPDRAFNMEIPKDAVVYDLRVQRQEIVNRLAAGAPGAVFSDNLGTVVVLTPQVGSRDEFLPVQLTLRREDETFSGVANPKLETRDARSFRTVTVGGREWTVSVLNSPRLASLEVVRGEIRIGDRTEGLEDLRVLKTGAALDLLMGFAN